MVVVGGVVGGGGYDGVVGYAATVMLKDNNNFSLLMTEQSPHKPPDMTRCFQGTSFHFYRYFFTQSGCCRLSWPRCTAC